MRKTKYKIHITKSFIRTYKRSLKKYPEIPTLYEEVLNILEMDPTNKTTNHKIKKLKNVKSGNGMWRIRIGRYRIRYDLLGNNIILHTIGHRKDIY